MDEMDRAYREDSALERECRKAARALDDVLAQDRRLMASERMALQKALKICKRTADHIIVKVWD